MQSTNSTALLMEQQNLADVIIQSKNVPVLANKFNMFAGKGKQRRLFQAHNKRASVVAENTAVVPDDTSFAEIVFDQRRVAGAIEVTQMLINDTEGIVDEVKNTLAIRVLKEMAAQAFGYGSKDGSEADKFQSIVDYNSQTSGKVNATDITTLTGVTKANIDAIYGEFAKDNVGEAIFVVDSMATVNDATLLDTDNQPLFKKQLGADGSVGTIYGVPVFVQDMNAKAKLVLMNPAAYSVCVFEGSFIDQKPNKIAGTVVVVANAYAQGKVVDPNGIKLIK